MVDWNPWGSCYAQSGIQRCGSMDYWPSAQYQNDESHHCHSPTTDGEIPGLSITMMHDSTTLSPNAPRARTSTRTTKYPRQPSGTTPPIQPQQRPCTRQVGGPDSNHNHGRSGEDYFSKPRQNDKTTAAPQKMAPNTCRPYGCYVYGRFQTCQRFSWLWMGSLPLRQPATPPVHLRKMLSR